MTASGDGLDPETGLEATLRALIEASRSLRAAAEEGRTEEVLTLVEQRERFIERLSPAAISATVASASACRALFEELRSEDRATLERLETWKQACGQGLRALSGSRTALAGYARAAATEPPLIDREL